jgi:hypothetical protein
LMIDVWSTHRYWRRIGEVAVAAVEAGLMIDVWSTHRYERRIGEVSIMK